MAPVTLDRINKVYENGFHAVQDLSIDIADGEFIVLVGPSGCGKSTALRMVAGLEDISSGTLSIGDKVVNSLTPKDRDIAMVFQSYALYPHMTVGDNIGYGLKIRKMEKAEIQRRVKKAADMLELTPLLDRKPKQLSGGQRQRVAMGRAIVREPQVFLMDEPLSNLDAKLRVQMRAEIGRIQQDLNVTTLYVTHDQIEAMTMGDRVVVLKSGLLMQVGAPQHLYDNPANVFVAGFIGSPPMNMGMGRIGRNGDNYTLQMGSATLTLAPELIAAKPALKNHVGNEVIVGLRSEDMEDASVRGDATETLDAKVVLTEALGSEIVVHFETDIEKVVTEDTKLLAENLGGADVGVIGSDRTQWVASFAPRSRVRSRDDIKVVVDTERLHFFDATTSNSINT
ncbi:sn-glycerol-3-phosphate ABC transporter ATP-binding protein UgpC [Nakamurella antarctica]|uniref:sn-glycerol-3-phosphate ABC transporter ATP-binding protein UgpC n=1 Tax=Nakamurella antarctica TaxID=1902245 RepID=A0A3G8ZI38_9ACTN|nr:sn-glycerol-3-phosphate ABC transporter ATP-binding protein UgpC [Nakamurella antarctica]AZI56870.1 sn-glycerol-3-phosphate ABC transporter ATP-binding protein UgpC [Nakamurella antarctica]